MHTNLAIANEIHETDTPRSLDEKVIATSLVESGQVSNLTEDEFGQRARILKKIADLTRAA